MPSWQSIVLILVGVVTCIGIVVWIQSNRLSSSSAINTTKEKNKTMIPDINDIGQWAKVFGDDFDAPRLDTGKWVTCYDWQEYAGQGCTNSGNDELEWYTPQQVEVKNGHVVLTAIQKPVTVQLNGQTKTFPYQSGMISTGRPTASENVKWSGRYGYFEAKIKFEGGKGVWPAFWLLPDNRMWPPEIDIMEFLGDRPDEILLNTHWVGPAGDRKEDPTTITGPDYTVDWHVYSVNWQPDRIEWFIDGVLQKTVTGEMVSHEPMEIILNLAVGGRLPGNPDSTTPFPRQMLIDYVNVYGKVLK